MGRILRILSVVSVLAVGQSREFYEVADSAWEPGDPEYQEWSEFVYAVDSFNRTLAGCAPRGPECYPERGVFDAGQWLKLRKRAAGLFDLEDHP